MNIIFNNVYVGNGYDKRRTSPIAITRKSIIICSSFEMYVWLQGGIGLAIAGRIKNKRLIPIC